jgi:iron complex outermembrane recepter protein
MFYRIAFFTAPLLLPLHAQDEPIIVAEELDEMIVSAEKTKPTPLGEASMQSVGIISEESLRRNATNTLGETLGWEPGVSSAYYGPGASRPVIRGFEGVRVRTLTDNLGTFDLSDVSPDHGVAVEPFLLENAEVHRGPASLLYGNSAIGGAVNSRSKVIARELPDRPVSGDWESRYETNGDGLSSAGLLSLKTGPVIFRLTGSARDSGDISIPSRARSEDYESTESPQVYDPSLGQSVPVPNPDGTLPNSYHDSSTWSAGVSFLPEDLPLLLGFSYSRFDSRYGVPYFFPGDATDLFGDHRLDMELDRYDLEARIDLDSGFISKIESRLAHGSYSHGEFFKGRGKDEGRDFLDTGLEKKTTEGRIDFHHRGFDGLTGIIGISGNREDFESLRAIFPPPDLQQVEGKFETKGAGIYFLETFERGEWTARLGHRLETSQVEDLSLENEGYTTREREVSNSLSASIAWQRENLGPLDRLSITGIFSRMERIPTATERYAFWNNAGIGRFLIGGDLDGTPLGLEKSVGYELGIEAEKGPITARFNTYHYDFDNFIFLQESPELTGGFGRAVQYIERAATFTGFEAELDWKLSEPLTLSLMSDYVRAENTTDNEPIPRMPPLRFGARLEWQQEHWTAGLEIRHATEQDRVKPAPRAELRSDAYTMLNADLARTFSINSQELMVFLRATNLLDEEARVSTSFRKDVAPLPGRGLTLGMRYTF